MASRKEDVCLCGPCNMRCLTVDASVWCPECDEGLCERCLEYHAVSKSLKKHLPIPVKSYLELSTFFHTLEQNCESHGESLDLFCPTHQEPCCAECISSQHEYCPGVNLFSKVVMGIKSSEYFSQVEKSIQDMKLNFVSIRQNREANVKMLEQQRFELKTQLQIYRKKLISHLDKLEHKLNDEIHSTIDKEISNLTQVKNTMNDHWEKLVLAEENLMKVADHGTEIQIYLALRNIEEAMITDTTNFMSLMETKAMKDITVKLDIATEFEHLLVADSLGYVKISETGISVRIVGLNSEKAQLSLKQSSLQSIKLEFIKSLELPIKTRKMNITDVCVLPDGKIICIDSGGSAYDGISLYDGDGKFLRNVFCPSRPFGIAIIKENKIAISSSSGKSVYIYNTNQFSMEGEMATGYKHFGLSSNGNELITAIRGTGISVINSSGKLLNVFPVDDNMLAYVHSTEQNIYYTNFKENILFCVSLDGKQLWKAQFDEMIGPRNICTDKFGNIFVASMESNNILVVYPDGKTCKVLLNECDGIDQPKAICIDAEQSLLVVASIYGSISLYNVIYS